jgi:bla regulator protein blaR1
MLRSMNKPAPPGRAVLPAAGIVIVTVASVLAQNQPAVAQIAFEVATIKLAASDAAPKNQMLRVSPNRISIPSMTLSWLIYTAYGEGMNTSVGLRGGPEWRNQTAYAIQAQAARPSTQRQFQAMLRTLLEDRFGLKVHTETETGNFYALVLDRNDGKLGPNVHAWDGTCLNGRAPTEDDDRVNPRCMSGYRPPGLFLDGATMFSAAELLSLPASRTLLGRVVQDRTGLAGRYRMELDYPFNPPRPADPAAPDSRPSLFTVIREQWGMKLEPAQGPYKVIVVDGAQRPTEN